LDWSIQFVPVVSIYSSYETTTLTCYSLRI